MDIRTELRNFIVENFMLGQEDDELTDSASLLDLGIIDSTGVLELVGFIEETYGFKVEDEELIPENLDSIDHLVEFITKKKQ